MDAAARVSVRGKMPSQKRTLDTKLRLRAIDNHVRRMRRKPIFILKRAGCSETMAPNLELARLVLISG